MPSDALFSEFAYSFISRLSAYNRALWHDAFVQFLDEPVRPGTRDYSEAGEPDAKATVIEPFVIVWTFLNSETIAIANITWSPTSPGGNPSLGGRL